MWNCRRITAALAALGCCLVAMACGGGGGGTPALVNLSGMGTITDSDPTLSNGRHYDTVTFTATRNGTVTLAMTRTNTGSVVDPYLALVAGALVIAESDDNGDSPDSLLVFTATQGQTYTVYFGTFDPADRGSYLWSIRES